MTDRELWYIAQAHTNGYLTGDSVFTKKCHAWLKWLLSEPVTLQSTLNIGLHVYSELW